MALAKSLHDLRALAADEIASIEEAAAGAGAAIGERLGHAAETARETAHRVRHVANDVAERSVRTVHDVQNTIAHRPLTAAFLAIGIGFLLAAVALRRKP